MYLWTYAPNRVPIKCGFGQTPSMPVTPEASFVDVLTNKYGVTFDSALGHACAVDRVMKGDGEVSGLERRGAEEMYDKTEADAKQIAAIRSWTLDDLRVVESACKIYCSLGRLPSSSMKINISRLSGWPKRHPVPLPSWVKRDERKMGMTKCGPCTGRDSECTTGTAQIMIFDKGMSIERKSKEKIATVIHELAHALLNTDALFWQQFSSWPRHRSLTGGEDVSKFMGPKDPRWISEDIADSVTYFLTDPGKLRKISKDRYKFLKENLQFSKSCR